MNYNEVLNYLFTRLPMFHRIGPAAYKANLDNTLLLDSYYVHPHSKYKTIHVAGTNGKGSVSHLLASVLQSAGYKTGLYTSPHLKDFRERIRINGKMISKSWIKNWVNQWVINNEKWKIDPSFFELTVIMAFDYFAENEIDIAVIEVGLGGRLDSTNIITPELSVITNIGYDHMALLGDTLEKIAFEKAGIIKPGIPVVIGKTQKETAEVFTECARINNSQLFFADNEFNVDYSLFDLEGYQVMAIRKNGEKVFQGIKTDLPGLYQQMNITTVLKALEILQKSGWKISGESIYGGLADAAKRTGLMGRWQVIGNNPLIICDTGHNSDGISQVVKQIENTPFKHLHIVFGMVNDKNPDSVLNLLPMNATYYFTKADIPRALDENILAEIACQFGLKGSVYRTVKEAFKAAKAKAERDDLIFIGGSTFVVAEIL